MNAAASRSHLLQLRVDIAAATTGRDLLDRKRESIIRALADHLPRRTRRFADAVRALREARSALAEAQDELGRSLVDAAALAQPRCGSCRRSDITIAGVRVPQVSMAVAPYRPHYGSASGSRSLDRAGELFSSALTAMTALACEDSVIQRLRGALSRTVRRLNALDSIVLPELTSQLRAVAEALEEEERDEAVRRKTGARAALSTTPPASVRALASWTTSREGR